MFAVSSKIVDIEKVDICSDSAASHKVLHCSYTDIFHFNVPNTFSESSAHPLFVVADVVMCLMQESLPVKINRFGVLLKPLLLRECGCSDFLPYR